MTLLLFLTLLLVCFGDNLIVRSSPLHINDTEGLLAKRNPPPPSVPPAIWTPAVIIFVVFVSLAALGCLGRALLRRSTELANPTTGAPITPDQLAGTINGGSTAGNNADATRRQRRPRRPRRTPSQMSVTSLPEYMKEPGEEEVVVFRGQSSDPEDAITQPAATVVTDHPSDDEDEGREDITQASIPLVPAPAYFEVVGDDEPLTTYYPPTSSSMSTVSTTAPLLGSSTLASSAPAPRHANLQSGLRTFLNRMSMSRPISSGSDEQQQQHRRGQSSNSAISNLSTRPASSISHINQHRTTHSTASAFFRRPQSSLSTHSINPSISQSRTSLTSPSMISLNSISAPLTHTASRTKFTFPNSKATGLPTLTPEQVKIIASRDAIGRFGMPYGPDAISFAASMSRPELGLGEASLPPPPEFEDVVAEVSGFGLRPQSTSASASVALEVHQEGVEIHTPSGSSMSRSTTATTVTATSKESGGSMLVSSGNEGNFGSAGALSFKPGETVDTGSCRTGVNHDHHEYESTRDLKPKSKVLTLNPSSMSETVATTSISPSSVSFRTNISPTTPTISDFGQILHSPSTPTSAKRLLVSPTTNGIHRSVSTMSGSSMHSSRTYATAAESLSLSVARHPLNSDSNLSLNSSSTSRSSLSLIVNGGHGHWSLPQEEPEEESFVDERGSEEAMAGAVNRVG